MPKIKKISRSEIQIPWYEDGFVPEVSNGPSTQDYLNLTPKDIYSILSKSVLEQKTACRAVSIMMFQHLHGHRGTAILAGPTGSGKSFLAENLKKAFPSVVFLQSIADLTSDGWSGNKKVINLFAGIESTYIPGTEISRLIFLDEADKCFNFKPSARGGAPSEDIQGELLSVIHGEEITVSPDKNTSFTLDTSKFSFMFAGAFDKQQRDKAEESGGIGFGSKVVKDEAYSTPITMEDIHQAGCISELCGRIGSVIQLTRIPADSYRKMLDTHQSGPIYELEREFGINIHISKCAKDEISHTAWQSKLGVRSIKNQLRTFIDDAIWEQASNLKVVEID